MLLSSPSDIPKAPERIVSLVPSQTELLADLGLDHEVVGITKFCVHPDTWFRSKTRIGGTKKLNIELIRQLNPELIIANKEENVQEEVLELAKDFPVWVTDVNTLEDALTMIYDIGNLTSHQVQASLLIQKINSAFTQIPSVRTNLKVAYLIWKDPYMVAGGDCFINDMLKYCGWVNVFGNYPRYPSVSAEEIIKCNADLILLSSEPYPFKGPHADEVKLLFKNMKKHPTIKLVDGEMFSWYGSRLLKAAEYFKKITISQPGII